MLGELQTVIGLEVHVQLATESKIFCRCSTKFGAPPNQHTCPVCLGMPGVLPVLNKRVVEYAIKTGLALNCQIAAYSKFDRKNYFYPDMPKAYQITQYDLPICSQGYLELEDDDGQPFKVRINRIHLEEDAGKLVHGAGGDITQSGAALVDLNRAGVPLIEIVTEPDIRSPRQASRYLSNLKSILEYLEISDCNMEEGSLRVDANVSIMPAGSKELGTRTELKNMNSFKALERALESEIERQTEIVRDGGQVVQETRTWDEKAERTISMRGKEEAMDYRYFPEPDLVPIELSPDWLAEIEKTIGELPREREKRFIQQYQLPAYDAQLLTLDKRLADFYETAVHEYHNPKTVSNWIMGDFLRFLKEKNLDYVDVKMTGQQLAEMLKLIDDKTISGKIAKNVFLEMLETGQDPQKIIEKKGLLQINDQDQLVEIVEEILLENPNAIDDYQAGKEQASKYLMGQVMKATKGKANPQLVRQILLKKLN